MRQLLIVFILGACTLNVLSQERLLLTNPDGHMTDTVDMGSRDFIKKDTLTRFLLGKSFSPDRCSSFSIVRKQYVKEQDGFRQFSTKTIKVDSKCSSLWRDGDDVYCLHLGKFEVRNGTVRILITDSDEKKLRATLKANRDFENRLKDRINKFINRSDCNGVRIE